MNKIKRNGFTLFELLVSVSIIGLLTALAVVSFSAAQKRGRDVRRAEDMKAVQAAAEQYYSVNSSSYPAAGQYLPGNSSWVVGEMTLLPLFPVDPKAANDEYECSTGDATGYCCCAHLENAGTGNGVGVNCNFGAGQKNYYCVKNQQ